MMMHWKDRIKEQVSKDLGMVYGKVDSNKLEDIAKWQIHNFGSRACDSASTSILTGLAHLIAFNGTDNTDASLQAHRWGCESECGSSILALAHRNVQAFGNDIDAVNSIANVPNAKIVSCVADCYNFKEAVNSIIAIAKENRDIVYVIRPDSGDGLSCVRHIISSAISAGLYKGVNGFPLPTNVRYIYGDSINPNTQRTFNETLRSENIPSTMWGIFGCGGWIVNNSTRDSLSSAYKLCAVGGNFRPVLKLSESPSKMSVPFLNEISRPPNLLDGTVNPTPSKYRIDRLAFRNGTYFLYESFQDIRNRANSQFDEYKDFARKNPQFGLNRECLHQSIIDLQNETYDKYQGSQIDAV
jgi:nicotinamide phosphoribosyltransferase